MENFPVICWAKDASAERTLLPFLVRRVLICFICIRGNVKQVTLPAYSEPNNFAEKLRARLSFQGDADLLDLFRSLAGEVADPHPNRIDFLVASLVDV